MLVASGYSLADIRSMTWPQLEAFTAAATHRRRAETLERAQIFALGVSAGFSGDHEALKRLAAELGLSDSMPTALQSRSGASLQRMAATMSDRGLVRMNHGPNRR